MSDKKTETKTVSMRGPHGMAGGSEKAKDFSKSIKRLVQYNKRFNHWLLLALSLAIIGTIFNVIGPHYLSRMANIMTQGLRSTIDVDAVVEVAWFLAIIYSLGLLFNLVQGFILSDISQRTAKRLRTDVSGKINRVPLKYFDSTSIGNILSRITNDIDTIGASLTQSLSLLASSVTLFVGATIMMFVTNWIMAIAGILASLVGFILMIFIIRSSQKYFVQHQQNLGQINGVIEENYTGHVVVKTYNAVDQVTHEFNELKEKLYQTAWKSQFISGLMMPLMGFIGNFGYVVVVITGAVLLINGQIQFGDIVAFMIYIRLFTQPMMQLAQVATSLQSASAASERVFEFLDEPEMADESHKTQFLEKVKGDIIFENIRFGYDENTPIINHFSAAAKAGQKIAIVGPTGAGKTTIVNLLMRFYEVWSGFILIDGIPLDSLTRENVHDLFGMVLQDTWLFEGTIRENIVYNQPDVSEEKLIEVTKITGLYHFIKTLPQGFDTVLDDQASLSAGQKQLVTIARAMIEDAPLLILDEATSSVDTRTELLIQRSMDTLMKGRTSFIIAHRLSTIKNADLILVMNEGDIIESGHHDQLIEQGGFYANLYNSQFEVA